MDELKPCPFCGSIAEMCSRLVSAYCGGRAYQVKCTYCGALIPEFWNREAEVKAWNRRAESEDKQTAGQSIAHAHWKWDGKSKDYNCSRCDYQGKMTLFCPNCGASMDGKEGSEITISCKLTNCEYNESGNCSARRIDRDGMCFTQRTEINDESEDTDNE